VKTGHVPEARKDSAVAPKEVAVRAPTRATIRLSELYAPVAAELTESRVVFRDELISDQGFIADLCGHVAQFHGKLLRPALLLLTGRACGVLQPAHTVLAAVVEMVHIATLVHDDVLDEADVRRRAATVNRLWGNERAVLMGDFLISHAFHLCSSLDSQFAARLIGATTNTVCEGEMLQVTNRDNLDLTEDEYLDIIHRKTAALIGTCCLLGAKYAGADEACVERMRRCGESLGLAFQIVDDVLDVVGDEAEVGKSLGRDAEMGKLTLPLIRCIQQGPHGTRTELLALLHSGEPPRRRIAEIVRAEGGIEYAQAVAAGYIAEARSALATLPPSDARESLMAMAGFVLARHE
jgi:octaprenyl-diphosphate synthase